MRLVDDLRLAIRHLRHAPGYAATAVVTLALAIGANSAIFSAVHAVLLRPSPVPDPAGLAVVWQTDTGGQAVVELTYRHQREWGGNGSIFTTSALMASHNWSAVLEGRGEPSRIWFAGVSAGFFETLGVAPRLGRTITAEDDVPNGPGVAVLNYNTWQRRFGGDPNVIGTSMLLDGSPLEIVGVMPEGLDLPRGAEFWAPSVPIIVTGNPPNTSTLNTFGVFYVVGRLRPGIDAVRARQDLDALEVRLDQTTPGRPTWGARAVVTPFAEYVFGPVRPALWALWAAVAVLLVIACANVAALMMTRASIRQREQAVRLALGASRGAIGRLWLTEIGVIAATGGVLGLLVAQGLATAIIALAPDDLPRIGDIAINLPVALCTFAMVIAAALLTGAIPLRRAGDVNLVQALDGSRTTSGRGALGARSALVVIQIGLAVVLLVATGLVVRSFVALRQIDLGFAPDRVLTAIVRPRSIQGPPNRWMDDLLVRTRAMPGVESAGAVYLRPLMFGPIGQGVRVFLEGQPETPAAASANPTLNHQIATPGYFETMNVRLARGRFFSEQDTLDVPRVSIVSETTARRLWPGEDPIGKKMMMATFTPGGPPRAWRTVVGVVRDVRYRGLDEVQLDVYDPALQVGRIADNVVVRTTGDPATAATALRQLAREMDPRAIVDQVTSMDVVVRRAQAPWRLTMWMFVLFGVLAFGLAALGLFGLVALDVAQRGREFAVRIALGASREAILRAVLLRASRWVAAGVAAGLLVSVLATRSMRSLLFQIAPDDLATYGTVLGVVVLVVAAAAYVPARRALRNDPRVLLKQE